MIISLRGSGRSPCSIHTDQSTSPWRKAYWLVSTPSSVAGPTRKPLVRSSVRRLLRSFQRNRSSSGRARPYWSHSRSSIFSVVSGAATVA